MSDDMLHAFGMSMVIDALQAPMFRKSFDGSTLLLEGSDNACESYQWTVKGFDVVSYASSVDVTRSKFDAWMDRIGGRGIRLATEDVLDRWEETVRGWFTIPPDKLRGALRAELDAAAGWRGR